MAAGKDFREEDLRPGQSSPPPAVLITFLAAICAGIAGSLTSGAKPGALMYVSAGSDCGLSFLPPIIGHKKK